MRFGRLLLLLITFGPCPHQWTLVLGSGDSVEATPAVVERSCKCCHKPLAPRQEIPPAPVTCCCRDMSYICESTVHAPDQCLIGVLAILDVPLMGIDVASVTRERESRAMLCGMASDRCAQLRI